MTVPGRRERKEVQRLISIACIAAVSLPGVAPTGAGEALGSARGEAGRAYHVSPAGSDDNPGTVARPLLTIQKALDMARPGDQIHVAAGVYREQVVVKRSGEPGRPLVLQGERGPVGEWLTVIDPGVPVGGWEPAPEVGPGVFKTKAVGFNPSMLTLDGRHIGKLDDRIMAGTRRVEWGPGETGFGLLALPADAKFDHGGGRWDYWDRLRAIYAYRDGITYIRFRDGDDPSPYKLKASSGAAGITIADKSYVVVRDLRVQGALDAVLITGSKSRCNTVERCSLSHGKSRVCIQNGAADNLVRDNLMTWGFYGSDSFGAQTPGAEGAGRFFTYRIFHSSNLSGFDWGIQVWDAGPSNEITGNCILYGLSGIMCLRTSGLKFHRNVLSNLSNVALILSTGGVGNHYYDNFIDDCNMGVRIHNYNAPGPRQVFLSRNLFLNPDDSGTHVFMHSLPNILRSAEEHPEVWIYHNSFAGGANVITPGGPAIRESGGMRRTHVINNVVSVRSWWSTTLAFDQIADADYNWVGGESSGHPAWLRKHNTIARGERLWEPGVRSSFRLPAGSHAQGTGIDLSKPFQIGEQAYPPLPGMKPGYFTGEAPDPGAIQAGRTHPALELAEAWTRLLVSVSPETGAAR
ncbi:MAG: right-handed parallel beta-helix repeat-containing protein [Armatimonadetes bacterium]|nr:right-handed parallel beta-helix repeat-containing protein [Armatimonadota bacterium]